MRILISILFVFALGVWARAQSYIRFEHGEVILRLELQLSSQSLDTLLINFGITNYGIDSLRKYGLPQSMLAEGWKIRKSSEKIVEVYKPLNHLTEGKGIKGLEMMGDVPKNGQHNYFFFPKANYGANRFKRISVFEQEDGKTIFFLPGNQSARRVILSGNFNAWSTLKTPMTKTDSGWVAYYSLVEGKHLYKFIVDGKWIPDLNNGIKEDDGQDGYNSVFYKSDYVFKLSGYTNARRVIVSGSFNDWDEKELELRKTREGWQLPMYLKEGTYSYKFIVDNNWITDPANPLVRPDGLGNDNSYFSIGKALTFKLEGFKEAKSVVVCGSFNDWNTQELKMAKTASGWAIDYVLASGNYSYKFLVDGQWITDPANPHTENSGDYINSVLCVNPNTRFRLKKYPNSKLVRLSGTFNNWNPEAYTMKKFNGEWIIDLYLEPNKYAYKFIVDGEWMADPENPLYEQNEWGNHNSVIWIQ